MKIGDLATTSFESVSPHDSVASVESRLLAEKHLVVMDGDRFVGLLTLSDTMERPHTLVVDCLTDRPQLDAAADLRSALEVMEQQSAHFLPVFREERFHGVASYKVISDILDRRVQEHKVRLEHYEALRTFAGGVAHDVNNLVMMMMNIFEVSRSHPEIPPEVVTHITRAEDLVARAQRLVSELSVLARSGEVSKEPTALEPFVREHAQLLAEGQDVELSFAFEDGLPAIELAREPFAQVISNLVFNAIQAMGEPPRCIEISGRRVTLDDPTVGGRYIELSLRDTGRGIDEDLLPEVFEPYVTARPGGTGLGLAIVAAVVADHGGQVSVTSREGEGTTFTILLPDSA